MPEFHEAMRRRGLMAGQMVLALAGHDRGRIFLLIEVAGRRVAMVDGQHYLWSRPKTKHVRHVRALCPIDAQRYAALCAEADAARREAETRRLIKQTKADCAWTQAELIQERKDQMEDR